ncbi:S-adenosyl-L-methionine-dependent methyltransferase [Tothia fuscella]|uniref:S-adenosyl-L-methionine-dependent methyltransferase n=1 Tax=Tothia fuscella TaxID=1048955 RepID=A0A9P4NHA6_9PEZI|nr:S-adenosyl-L-methionine-dependent methyltransferase [Tothia fuscella]
MADQMAEANRQHWDSKAHEYDTKPWQQKMIGYIVSEAEQQREFFGIPAEKGGNGNFRLLDYACGPGTMSKALSPYTTSTLGIDISENMTKTYNTRSQTGLLPPHCSAITGNLLSSQPYIINSSSNEKEFDALSKAEFNDFDAVVVGMGFHHFDRYADSIKGLGERVKVGGTVGIVDLFGGRTHDDALTTEQKAQMHKGGFTEEEMKGYMEEAGLVDIALVELSEAVVMQMHGKDIARRIFFARGRKA